MMTREEKRLQRAYKHLIRARAILQQEWDARAEHVTDSYTRHIEPKGARLPNMTLAHLLDTLSQSVHEFNVHA